MFRPEKIKPGVSQGNALYLRYLIPCLSYFLRILAITLTYLILSKPALNKSMDVIPYHSCRFYVLSGFVYFMSGKSVYLFQCFFSSLNFGITLSHRFSLSLLYIYHCLFSLSVVIFKLFCSNSTSL